MDAVVDGGCYTYKGKEYFVLRSTRVEMKDSTTGWTECVVYYPSEPRHTDYPNQWYVRELTDFQDKFVKCS